MYISPIEVNMVDNMHRLVMQTTEDGIMRAVWQMGFKVDAEQLTCALTQDKKRYEYAYDQGWHDCEEHYKKQLEEISKQLAEIIKFAKAKDDDGE